MNILYILILIISVVIHEVAHGYAADRLGDPTPRLAGRLSLNPFVHIDTVGSILLPLLLFFSGSPIMFGWAKPVPFNPYYLKNQRWGGALVAFAGPLSNLLIALILGLGLHILPLSLSGVLVLKMIILTNISLAIFNLVPIPPLDGHHILFAVLPRSLSKIKSFLQSYGFFFVIIFIFFGGRFLGPVVEFVYELLV